MKALYIKNSRHLWHSWMMTAFIALFSITLNSCNDETSVAVEAAPFDPSQPVVVSDFLPKTGGMGQRIVIYGKNFGNNVEDISVLIGGKEAVVISTQGESIYCLVPRQAFGGEIEVRVGKDPQIVSGKSKINFDYLRKKVVSTVVGYRNTRGDEPWKDGKFKDPDQNKMASGFWDASHFRFDPLNSKHLWVTFDGNNGLYLVNFEDSTVTKTLSSFSRPRSVDFSKNGQHMIIAEDRGGEDDPSTKILSRATNFTDPKTLTKYRQCNGAAIHPINGEMYFNSYEKGQFFRYDLEKYLAEGLGDKAYTNPFVVHDPEWEFKTFIHPSGNYAYIVVINRHYILRIDYNWDKKQFNQPYLVCGQLRSSGYVDGVGSTVRLNTPYQGVFVKNQDYVAEGKSDVYDFYFTEMHNHAVRSLAPTGSVTTFAGRGSASINPNPWGYVDGDLRTEARFDRPTGIAYNEEEQAFYIGDQANRRIRKIALEEID